LEKRFELWSNARYSLSASERVADILLASVREHAVSYQPWVLLKTDSQQLQHRTETNQGPRAQLGVRAIRSDGSERCIRPCKSGIIFWAFILLATSQATASLQVRLRVTVHNLTRARSQTLTCAVLVPRESDVDRSFGGHSWKQVNNF
jgi:hypothetical protein